MSRITISERAATALSGWATALSNGTMSVDDLPIEVAQFFQLGAASVVADKKVTELEAEVRRLNHEANQLYLSAFTPKERQAKYLEQAEARYQRDEALIAEGIDPDTLSVTEANEEAAFVLGIDVDRVYSEPHLDRVRAWISANYDCDLDNGRFTRRADVTNR